MVLGEDANTLNDVLVEKEGHYLLLTWRSLIRVDPLDGKQTMLISDLGVGLRGMCFQGPAAVLVTDSTRRELYRVDLSTLQKTVVASVNLLSFPVSVALGKTR